MFNLAGQKAGTIPKRLNMKSVNILKIASQE